MATKAPAAPPKEKPPKDTVARNDMWTLRIKHRKKVTFGPFEWHTKPKLFLRPRLRLLISSRFEVKTVSLNPEKVVSIGWWDYGGLRRPSLLRLRVDHPEKRRGFWQKVMDEHPDLAEYDFTFGWVARRGFIRLKDAGVSKYGWKVNNKSGAGGNR